MAKYQVFLGVTAHVDAGDEEAAIDAAKQMTVSECTINTASAYPEPPSSPTPPPPVPEEQVEVP